MRHIALILVGVGIAACTERQGPRDVAEVSFRLETECSFEVEVDIRIDGRVVSTESLRAIGQPADDVTATYYITAGEPHAIGAHWVDDIWPDTTVTLAKGQHHEQRLFLYCS